MQAWSRVIPGVGARRFLFLLLVAGPLVAACEEDAVMDPIQMRATVAGQVTSSETGAPIPEAEVSIGGAHVTTGTDGRFEVRDLIPGTARIHCTATGFEDFQEDILIPAEGISRNIAMIPVELSVLAHIANRNQVVLVFHSGAFVADAVITLNGLPIPLSTGGPFYAVGRSFAVGTALDLEIQAEGVTIQGVGSMLEAPVLTAPAGGSVFHLTDDITVTWTSTANPEEFAIVFGETDFGPNFTVTAPGSAREITVAASDVGVMDDDIGIVATGSGSLSGPADPESSMRISNGDGQDTRITIGP